MHRQLFTYFISLVCLTFNRQGCNRLTSKQKDNVSFERKETSLFYLPLWYPKWKNGWRWYPILFLRLKWSPAKKNKIINNHRIHVPCKFLAEVYSLTFITYLTFKWNFILAACLIFLWSFSLCKLLLFNKLLILWTKSLNLIFSINTLSINNFYYSAKWKLRVF